MVRKKRIIIITNCAILALHSVLIFTLTTFPVFALSAGGLQTTIASIIVSLMLQTGVAPVNNAWLQNLNTSYGVESSIGTIGDAIQSGLLTETASGLVDTGLSEAIAAQSAYTDLGLAELFTTTADDVGVVAGSGAVNLANSAINCGTAGTIGAFAGAATVGVGLGILINNVRESIGKFISNRMALNTSREIVNNLSDTDTLYYSEVNGRYWIIKNDVTHTYGTYYTYQNETGYYIKIALNRLINSTITYDEFQVGNNRWLRNRELNSNQITTNNGNPFTYDGMLQVESDQIGYVKFPDAQSANAYVEQLRQQGYTPQRESPDIVGPEGMQSAVYNPDTGQFEYPYIAEQVPDGYDMEPVNMDDYANFIEDANDNIENDIPDENGNLFEDLINDLLVAPSLVPDQGVDIPAIPDRPIIPDQPNIPAKDPISQEEQDLINSGLVNTELANVFPFCIPFDIYAMLMNLKVGREAPVIVFEFPEQFGWGGIEIDLSRWDEVASILRHMELLLFIIGLAVNTRNLIGATG